MIKKLLFILILISGSVSAEIRTIQQAGVSIEVPDNGWITTKKGEDLEIKSPDKRIFIIVNVDDDNDLNAEVIHAMSVIKKYHDNVDIKKETKSTQVNDLSISYVEGTGITKKGKKPADWMVAATANKKGVILLVMAMEGSLEKYKNDIKTILNSFKKA